ncbi:MAG TPA: glycosyltransferase family 4 protein [Mycobacteriales bacterium]|jgi:glycosyltransferase involved in cell wall biosynthesis|nr:glycosyltransferase family 4 protein [Mycobacteriales bacterium]
MSPESKRLQVLAVSDYWNSTDFTGGVTVLNRALCRALADRDDMAVTCRVGEPGPIRDPLVTIRTMSSIPGVDAKGQLLRLDGLPRNVDVIVGHSTHSGGAAQYLRDQRYADALSVHLMHTTPAEYARYRGDSELADLKTEQERTLIAGADLVVGVGPLLNQEAARLARSTLFTAGRQPAIHELIPGMPSDGMVRNLRGIHQTKFNLLMSGRIQDEAKRAETAAAALRLSRAKGHDVHLTVVGVPAKSVRKVEEKLSLLAGNLVKVVPFTGNQHNLAVHIAEADLVVAPAVHEDWGLAPWEALGRRVPTLLSATSGVARFLSDPSRVPPHLGAVFTVPEPDDVRDRPALWAGRIERFLDNPDAYARLTHELGDLLIPKYTWGRAARKLGEHVLAIYASPRQRPTATARQRRPSRPSITTPDRARVSVSAPRSKGVVR